MTHIQAKKSKIAVGLPTPSFFLSAGILLLAFGLRLLLWSAPLHQPANDEVEYITVARDLLAGRGWQFYEHYHWLRAPLYPLFLAGSLWLAGGDPTGGEALYRAALPNIALSVLNVWLIARLARALFGRRAELLAAIVTGALWTFATFASLYMAETLFTTLFTAGLLCLVPGDRRQETGDRRQETGDRRQETGDRRQETGDGRREAGDRRQETGDRRQETGGRRQETGGSASLAMLALGGALLGLATLTRSASLLFLPAIALWLLGQEPRTKNQEPPEHRPNRFSALRSQFLAPMIFLVAATLAIAPWTIRNQQAYGRFIPVETGLSYNLWAFNEPRERPSAIFRTLEQIANPAERADYATAKGLTRLREDPAILLRKLWPNWVYLWRVKPIEDRFLQEHYYSDVPLALFAAALVFDDGLYLLVALAGVVGLARAVTKPMACRNAHLADWLRRMASPHALLAAWLLYAVGTMLLTHGEARYRHFLFPVLIPYAAGMLAGLFRRETGDADVRMEDRRSRIDRRAPRPSTLDPRSALSLQTIVALALAALLGGTILAYYPWGWAGQSIARGWYAMRAERAAAAGDLAAALRFDEQALAAERTPDGLLRLGDHARAQGDSARAIKAYRGARALTPGYTPAVARLGDLYRAQSDQAGARAAFSEGYVGLQELADWSWRELRPPPLSAIAVGDGLDYGYVGGMYPAEPISGASARWTNGRGTLRFGGAAGANARGALVRLRLAAPQPGAGAVATEVCGARGCVALSVGPEWRVYSVPLALVPGDALEFELRSDTFRAPDGRLLGVVVDQAALVVAAQ